MDQTWHFAHMYLFSWVGLRANSRNCCHRPEHRLWAPACFTGITYSLTGKLTRDLVIRACVLVFCKIMIPNTAPSQTLLE